MRCSTHYQVLPAAFLLLATTVLAAESRDPPPVAKLIDADIESELARRNLSPATVADDVEFMRRAYLDITGRVPSVEQSTAFLASVEGDKRRRWIDQLPQ